MVAGRLSRPNPERYPAAVPAAVFGVPTSCLLNRSRGPWVLDEEFLEREREIVVGIVRLFGSQGSLQRVASLGWGSETGVAT